MKSIILSVLLCWCSPGFAAGPRDMQCLATAIQHEARGEPLAGKLAVAYTVLSRVGQKKGNTICRVVFSPNQFTGLRRIKYDSEHMDLAKYAHMVYRLSKRKPKYTHFHTTYVTPRWASSKKMVRVARIGNHIFYLERLRKPRDL